MVLGGSQCVLAVSDCMVNAVSERDMTQACFSRTVGPETGSDEEMGLRVGESKACVIIPAFESATTVAAVIVDLLRSLARIRVQDILVVDDGSRDGTAYVAESMGVRVFTQPNNRGKGAALVRGLVEARANGYDVALTVDADGQHPAASATEVLHASNDPQALVLGVRDLQKEKAPWKNRFSNGVSNFFLSWFCRQTLSDTQCGLRRYPVKSTLALGANAKGYAFEAEVLLRASAAGFPIVQRSVHVVYPPEEERVTHFDSVRDPVRIVVAVVRTLRELPRLKRTSSQRP